VNGLSRAIFKDIRTVAVSGLSPNPAKASHLVARYLQENGFRIVPIYPKEETILGEKAYRSLSEIPFGVDMLLVFRRSEYAERLAEEAASFGGIKIFWLQEGITSAAACKKAVDAGMTAVEDRCVMKFHKMLKE
jgi:predicted CoA-binding protein